MFKALMRGHRRRSRSAPLSAAEQIRNQLPDASELETATILAVQPFTMTSPERILGLIRAVSYIVRAGIPGDFVECGVWRGGSMLAAAQTLLLHEPPTRHLWLYDTFEGMSEPSNKDIDWMGNNADRLLQSHRPNDPQGIWCLSRLDEVRQTMARSGYPESRTHFVVGKVEDSLLRDRPNQIALLRLDTDWYESTRAELLHLFPLLVDGGVLIIDDYGHWQGCRNAVDEYFQQTGQTIHLARMDYTGRIGIKGPSRAHRN